MPNLFLLLVLVLVLPPLLRAGEITVSAAASLQGALTEITTAFHKAHPDIEVALNFGASNALARQIENGAPVDIFLSAATGPMDRLLRDGLVKKSAPLLENELVLIARSDLPSLINFVGLRDGSVRTIAIGEPATVPAGEYAVQTLESLGFLAAVRPKFVLAKDVRQVLTHVAAGNADAGFVYRTDAATTDSVRIVANAPSDSHDPIRYPVAIVAGSRNAADAKAYAAFLRAPDAAAVFERFGFRPAREVGRDRQ